MGGHGYGWGMHGHSKGHRTASAMLYNVLRCTPFGIAFISRQPKRTEPCSLIDPFDRRVVNIIVLRNVPPVGHREKVVNAISNFNNSPRPKQRILSVIINRILSLLECVMWRLRK